MKPKWLDRRIAHSGPYLCLALSEKAFLAAMKHCRIASPPEWVSHPAHARAYMLENGDGEQVAVVGMRGWEGRDPIEVAGLLVHEAVHVWQAYVARIGERNPGDEQEAYAIQGIAQELMADFARQVKA